LSGSGFGVATAASPTGPFEYTGRVRYPEADKSAGWRDDQDGIDDGDWAFGKGARPFHRGRLSVSEYPYDPALLFHDDRLFLYFGLLNCSVIELDPADKRTVIRNPATGEYVTPVFRSTVARHLRAFISGRRRETAFVNGPSIREIDGRFWLTYFAIGGGGFSGLCHAVADDPLGPFTPRGPLVSLGNAWKNTPPGPTDRTGNIHGGMFEAGDIRGRPAEAASSGMGSVSSRTCRKRGQASRKRSTQPPSTSAPQAHSAVTPRPCQGVSVSDRRPTVAWMYRPAVIGEACSR
jgi:arabinoxylan arabinofuranohydrolase